jgi:ribose/xylose/arabinose/galactoside ABC-type transport system permease subunit
MTVQSADAATYADQRSHGRTTRAQRIAAKIIRSRPLILVVLIVLLTAYMSYFYDISFPTLANAKAVLLDASVQGVMVIGMMILLIGGTFDLSIGGILTMTGIVVGALIANHGWDMWLAVLAALAVGGLCGLANGLLVTKIRINALIATLATGGIFYGLAQLFDSSGVTPISNSFAKIGQNQVLGFQLPIWIALVLVIVMSLAVSQTRFFRQYYFVGGNERAARLSGIPAQKLIVTGFVLMGVLAAVGAILTSARLNAATTDAGTGIELQVITAAVLGGASLTGGEGTVIGGVLGVLFIALVDNALVIINVDPFWQQIVIGGVLLFALSLDRLKHTRFVQQMDGESLRRTPDRQDPTTAGH